MTIFFLETLKEYWCIAKYLSSYYLSVGGSNLEWMRGLLAQAGLGKMPLLPRGFFCPPTPREMARRTRQSPFSLSRLAFERADVRWRERDVRQVYFCPSPVCGPLRSRQAWQCGQEWEAEEGIPTFQCGHLQGSVICWTLTLTEKIIFSTLDVQFRVTPPCAVRACLRRIVKMPMDQQMEIVPQVRNIYFFFNSSIHNWILQDSESAAWSSMMTVVTLSDIIALIFR